MNILLTGATGFVGSHMAHGLVREGHHVRAVVRNPKKAQGIVPPGGAVTLYEGDVVTGSGLDVAMQGCEAVIHLVGIIIETGGATFDKVHYSGTQNVLGAANKAGVARFVQMSALGASPDGVSEYQRSKWRAEEAVRNGGIPYTILRPSIIFGPRDGFVSQMVQVMKSTPLIRPVVGTGKYLFRPVYIDDLVDCFMQSLTSTAATGRTIELGGAEELTLDQILDAIAGCIHVHKTAVHIPFGLMYLAAYILERAVPRPPVTTDQLRMLRQGSTCDVGPMLEIFRVRPMDFRTGLSRYLCAQ